MSDLTEDWQKRAITAAQARRLSANLMVAPQQQRRDLHCPKLLWKALVTLRPVQEREHGGMKGEEMSSAPQSAVFKGVYRLKSHEIVKSCHFW
jgi:hypothetical protein